MDLCRTDLSQETCATAGTHADHTVPTGQHDLARADRVDQGNIHPERSSPLVVPLRRTLPLPLPPCASLGLVRA